MAKIGYARISTDKQSTDMQLNALKQANCDVIYSDICSSMKVRTELNKCLQSLNKNDVLVVYKLDRLGRSVREILNILHELELINVSFISLQDYLDTSTPQGRLMLNILLSFGQFERELTVQRVNQGIKTAREKGIKLGRPDKLTVDQIKELKKLRKAGFKISFLMDKYNISRQSFYNYLNM